MNIKLLLNVTRNYYQACQTLTNLKTNYCNGHDSDEMKRSEQFQYAKGLKFHHIFSRNYVSLPTTSL